MEQYLLCQIQQIQDLLAESFGVSIVLVDHQGKELTIPSRLPISCIHNEGNECRKKIISQDKEINAAEQAIISLCPQHLYTFIYRTGFTINGSNALLICGRISDRKRIENCMSLITAIYSLPLVVEGAEGKKQKKLSEGKITHYTDSETLNTLTPQELKILSAIGKGYSNKEIAAELFISANTVKSHLSRLFRKLNLNSRTGAAIFALEHNLSVRNEDDNA